MTTDRRHDVLRQDDVRCRTRARMLSHLIEDVYRFWQGDQRAHLKDEDTVLREHIEQIVAQFVFDLDAFDRTRSRPFQRVAGL